MVEVARARRSAIEEHHRDEPHDSGYAPTHPTESLGNCVPVPGLVIRRSSSAGSAVIRRSIAVGGTAVATPADFLPLAKRKSWDAVELKVLQFMCDDTKQDYEFRKSKWREDLLGHMSDMPRAFYNRLTSVAQCDQIIAWYESEGVKDKTGRLDRRRTTLIAAEFRADFTPGFGLEVPTLPPGYKPSVKKKLTSVSASADRPPWQKMTNPYSGGGKETGIQNVHLSQQLVAQGLQQPNAWGTAHDAVCVSCLRWTNVTMMDTDHAQPLKVFKAKLLRLAEAMSAEPAIYDELHTAANIAGTSPTPVENYFIVKGTGKSRTFRLNEEGLTAYSHNVDNLMKMCKACNQGGAKHFGGLAEWLTANPFYGKSLADTFPSGPGNMRIVDQNTSGQAPAPAILGHLGANYSEAVKLTYPAHQYSELSHRKITSTARKQFEVKQAPMSATRTEREQELEERGRRNEVMVRSTKVLHQQFLKKDRPKIRAGSPEREEKALEQHFQTSAETRKRKRTAEDPEYDGYLKLARSGAPTDVSTVGDAKKKAVAQQANQEGQRQFAQDRVIGSTDALTANLSLDQSLATMGRPAGYIQGFSETLQQRSDAAAAGYMAGLNNDALALPFAADPAVAIRLVQDYVAGYNRGKAEAALGMVT